MGVDASEFGFILLSYAFVIAVFVGVLVAFYWVIRKAVAAGIRDAQGAPTARKDG